jgi:hypothetical protein
MGVDLGVISVRQVEVFHTAGICLGPCDGCDCGCFRTIAGFRASSCRDMPIQCTFHEFLQADRDRMSG